MRRTLFIFIGLPVMLGWLTAPALNVSDLQKEMAGGLKVTVIDIRSPAAFAQEHIPGAINIPASLCPLKQLPPLGNVVVCGDGLGREDVAAAAAALSAKPGLKVETLDGGFAGWKNSQALTTRGAGFKPESFNYISYAQLKTVKPAGVVLYDLRKTASAPAQVSAAVAVASTNVLTDLNAEFPGLIRARSRAAAVQSAAGASSLLVLIDNGDGTAEEEARRLKLGGNHNYVILAGGELVLARHGQAGLQRNPAGTAYGVKQPAAPGTAN